MSERCFTCEIVTEYVSLANQFTQDLSQALIGPMQILFLSLSGLWIVIQGVRLILLHTTIADVFKEFFFIALAWILLIGEGPGLVNEIYSASLSMMGSAASVALKVGAHGSSIPPSNAEMGYGLVELVKVNEKGIVSVFNLATALSNSATMTDWSPGIYAFFIALPYFFVLVVYFAQVVVSVFRIIFISIVSPFLLLGFGFVWGRGMAVSGLKTILSSFMVLFGSTAAIAILLYGINKFNIGLPDSQESVRELASYSNPKLLLIISMGWLGTAFMAEAVGIANSITGSVLSNWGVGVITSAAGVMGATALKLGMRGSWWMVKEGIPSRREWVNDKGSGLSEGAQALLRKIRKEWL